MEFPLLILAVVSFSVAIGSLVKISKFDPWVHNLDMDINNVANALFINADQPGGMFDQPGLPMKVLLAWDYRLRHKTGGLTVWNFEELESSQDPISAIPLLVDVGRVHYSALVGLFILGVGFLVFEITRNFGSAALGVILASGSSGLLFHGLLSRPELLCAFFGLVAGIFFMWRGTKAGLHGLWLFGAGVCVGFATLTKLPGVIFSLIFCGWILVHEIFGILEKRQQAAGEGDQQPASGLVWSSLLVIAACGSTWWIVHGLIGPPIGINLVDANRLQLAAGGLACFTFLILILRVRLPVRVHRVILGFLAIVGGALASLPMLRTTMSARGAGHYIKNVIHTLVTPSDTISAYASNTRVPVEFIKFLKHDQWLFAVAGVSIVLSVFFFRGQRRLHVVLVVFYALAAAMAALLARRYFIIHYVIFVQVPLVIVLALSFDQLRKQLMIVRGRTAAWMATAGAGLISFALVFFGVARLKREYASYQGYADLSNQVEMLYRTGSLPGDYRRLMVKRYGDAANFERSLRSVNDARQPD